MDIKVTFQDGRWATDPHPALVIPGTKVRWVVRAPTLQLSRLRWTIDFGTASPFGSERRKFTIETKNTGLGNSNNLPPGDIASRLEKLGLLDDLADHRGATLPLPADQPGQYKYDLHLEDAETEEHIGDDDPLLYVIRPLTIWL